MGATVGFGDTKVGQEEGHRLGGHRGSAISMKVELTRKDQLLLAGIGNQPLGELGTFAIGYHPADDIAAKDVQDDIEIVVRPFRGA